MSTLNPQKKQLISQFQNQTNAQQAQILADKCNELGITKQQLAQILNVLNK